MKACTVGKGPCCDKMMRNALMTPIGKPSNHLGVTDAQAFGHISVMDSAVSGPERRYNRNEVFLSTVLVEFLN
jgi:hypothetical protein